MNFIKQHSTELFLFIAVLLGIWWGLSRSKPVVEVVEDHDNPTADRVELVVGESTLMVEIRDTEEGRALGLSGRNGLTDNQGMLFIYPEKVTPTFWMKDMKFDLDMIWIKDGVVVDISRNVSAPTSEDPVLKTASPSQAIDTILEVNAGWANKNQIGIGDEVIIK